MDNSMLEVLFNISKQQVGVNSNWIYSNSLRNLVFGFFGGFIVPLENFSLIWKRHQATPTMKLGIRL